MFWTSKNARHAKQTKHLLRAMKEAQQRAAQPVGQGLCFLCVGAGEDLLHNRCCPRCKGSGVDPDPLAYVAVALAAIRRRTDWIEAHAGELERAMQIGFASRRA